MKKEIYVEDPEVKTDTVNHPDHYQGAYECIDVLKDVLGNLGFQGFCMGNVIKYCWRHKKKHGIEDLKKARWYLDKLIQEWENGLSE